MEKPKILYSLRPSSVLEVLDQAFRIYRDNFVAYVGLAAVVVVPVTVINYLGTLWSASRMEALGIDLNSPRSLSANPELINSYLSQTFSLLAVLAIVGVLAAFIEAVFINGPISYMASERSLGRRASISAALQATRNRFLPLAGALILFYLILAAMGIGMSFTFFLCGLGIPILIYVGIVLNAFLTPVMILERVGVRQGLSRAWALARARFWAVVGVTVFIVVVRTFFSVSMQTAVALLSNGTIGLASARSASIVTTVLQAGIEIFLAPLFPLAFTLLYEDSRIRLEGLDIALQNVDSPEPRISDVATPPGEGLINRTDAGNLVIFTVITLVLLVVIYGGLLIFAQGLIGAGLR